MRWFLTGEGESGLDQEAPVQPEKEEDPEKEILKEELLGMYKDKVRMLEREIREHCEGLAERLGI